MLMSFLISGLTVNVAKKLMDMGIIIKYPNKTPKKNNKEAIDTNALAYFRSFSYKAGLMNFHNNQSIYGKAIINPAVIQVQINKDT
jgi:hypothetical protein